MSAVKVIIQWFSFLEFLVVTSFKITMNCEIVS